MNISFKDTLKSDGTSFFDTCFTVAEDYFDYSRGIFLNTHRKIEITHTLNSSQIKSIHAIACEHFADKNASITFGDVCRMTVWAVSILTLVVPACLLITDLAMRHFKLKHYEIPSNLAKQISIDLNNKTSRQMTSVSPLKFYTNTITNEKFCILLGSDKEHLKRTPELQKKINDIDRVFHLPVQKQIQIDGKFYSIFVYDKMNNIEKYADQSKSKQKFKQLIKVALEKKYKVSRLGAFTINMEALYRNELCKNNYEVFFWLIEAVSNESQLKAIEKKVLKSSDKKNKDLERLIHNIDNKIKNMHLSEFYQKQNIITKNELLKIPENTFSDPFKKKIAETIVQDINEKIVKNKRRPHHSNRAIVCQEGNIWNMLYHDKSLLPKDLKLEDAHPFCNQMIFEVLSELQKLSIINAFTYSFSGNEVAIQA